MLPVRVVELAITDTNKSDANREPTGSSSKLVVAFIMSNQKSLQQQVPLAVLSSIYYKLESRFFLGVLNKKFRLLLHHTMKNTTCITGFKDIRIAQHKRHLP